MPFPTSVTSSSSGRHHPRPWAAVEWAVSACRSATQCAAWTRDGMSLTRRRQSSSSSCLTATSASSHADTYSPRACSTRWVVYRCRSALPFLSLGWMYSGDSSPVADSLGRDGRALRWRALFTRSWITSTPVLLRSCSTAVASAPALRSTISTASSTAGSRWGFTDPRQASSLRRKNSIGTAPRTSAECPASPVILFSSLHHSSQASPGSGATRLPISTMSSAHFEAKKCRRRGRPLS
mmetsp:Transcript_11287/g.32484  ORF Transcript_11287/g.32484 Transcript_11287/m.32484 type:complete len:238 (-) Transcript_11287:268-981(-)